MSKKLMLLAAGALTALAFAALPAVASAGEFPIHCASPSGGNCISNITGGTAELNNTNNEGITCSSVSGTASTPNNGIVGTAQLTFHGCKALTFFNCNSPGQPSGTIKTNVMNSRLVYIDPNKTTPGVTLSNINVTFTCAGFANRTVTGSIIGHFENPRCGQTVASTPVDFQKISNGHQRWTQVTTTGAIDDLIASNDAGGAYVTSSQTGTGTLTSTTGLTALTC